MNWCHFDQEDSYMLVVRNDFNFMAICHQTITIYSLMCSFTILIACWNLWIKHWLDGHTCSMNKFDDAYCLVDDLLSANSFVWLIENQGYMTWMSVILYALHVIIWWMILVRHILMLNFRISLETWLRIVLLLNN